MNKVSLIGRLTRNPDVKISSENVTITHFSIAVDRKFKRQNETADFINWIAFGKTAEFVGNYFTKGKKIGLSGRIQTGNYINREGKKVYTTDVVVEEAEFIESKQTNTETKGFSIPNSDGFMDIPDNIDEELPFN